MLFLSGGSFIFQFMGNQDSRYYGRGVNSFSSYLFFLVRCLCLSGFPFFVGFYSKDFIISSFFSVRELFLYLFFLGGCILTVVYRVRIVWVSYVRVIKCSSFFSFGERNLFFVRRLMLFVFC